MEGNDHELFEEGRAIIRPSITAPSMPFGRRSLSDGCHM